MAQGTIEMGFRRLRGAARSFRDRSAAKEARSDAIYTHSTFPCGRKYSKLLTIRMKIWTILSILATIYMCKYKTFILNIHSARFLHNLMKNQSYIFAWLTSTFSKTHTHAYGILIHIKYINFYTGIFKNFFM